MPEHEQTDYRQYAKGRTLKDGEWVETGGRTKPRTNAHPTVKPIALMRYLVRLITPPGGTVLDPFAGSGSTICAAVLEGFTGIGIEREPDYVEIAKRRVEHWSLPEEARTRRPNKPKQTLEIPVEVEDGRLF
jgi:site-specific DNA-methyltransferase (adenine-specific)